MSKNPSQDYSLPPLLQGGDHWWSSTAINGAQSFAAEASHQSNTLMLAQVSDDWFGNLILFAVVALFFWWASTLPDTVRCPKCDRKKALIKTGATKGGGRVKRRVEWKCKYCGYREWKDKYTHLIRD